MYSSTQTSLRCEWVMSHIWMKVCCSCHTSHVTHMNGKVHVFMSHTWVRGSFSLLRMSHVTCMNKKSSEKVFEVRTSENMRNDPNFTLWWHAVYCSALQCVAVCCSVLQCVAVCCSVLQCVAVCCSELQCFAVCCSNLKTGRRDEITPMRPWVDALPGVVRKRAPMSHVSLQKSPISPQKNPYLDKKFLLSVQGALYLCKGALKRHARETHTLGHSTRPLYKKAQYLCTRALYLNKRALYLYKRAL